VNDDTKRRWLNAAEVFDSWRVVPRLIVGSYIAFLMWITSYFALSYFGLPPAERGAAVTAFASVVLTAAFGALVYITKLYFDTGRNWDARDQAAPPPSQ
jgi:hypothetical protein